MKTNLKRLKLAKLIQLVSDITTDKGVLTLEGELEVGAEVFMVDSEGQLVPAADGTAACGYAQVQHVSEPAYYGYRQAGRSF